MLWFGFGCRPARRIPAALNRGVNQVCIQVSLRSQPVFGPADARAHMFKVQKWCSKYVFEFGFDLTLSGKNNLALFWIKWQCCFFGSPYERERDFWVPCDNVNVVVRAWWLSCVIPAWFLGEGLFGDLRGVSFLVVVVFFFFGLLGLVFFFVSFIILTPTVKFMWTW